MKKSDPPAAASFIGRLFKFFFRTPKNDPETSSTSLIMDISHMLKRDPGSPVHLLYVLLFGSAITAALWQHGSAFFTLGILALLLGMGFFIYIPYRFINTFSRQFLACLIFFGACFWISYRLQKATPFDLALLEGLILCGFSFLVNGTFKAYNYLFFITIFLLIYGGLVPRKLLLLLIPGMAIGGVLLFFAERKTSLVNGRKLIFPPNHSRFREFFRSWHVLLLQLLIAIPIFLYIFSLFPLTDSGTQGYFEVSFITSRTSSLPPDLRKWLRQDRKILRDASGDLQIDGQNPTTVSPSAEHLVSGSDGQLNGNGSGPPGDALLFTAQMPLKLYHLANLYDIYDGKTWHTSQSLVKNRSSRHRKGGQYRISVSGKYIMQKWISPILYAPYQPVEFQSGMQNESANTTNWYRLFRQLRQTSFNAKFKESSSYPALPFHYMVTSRLTLPTLPRVKKPGETTLPELQLYQSFDMLLQDQLVKEKERLAKAAAAAARLQAARERQKKLAEARAKAARERQKKLAAARAKAARERQKKLAEARALARKKAGKKPPKNQAAQSQVKKVVQKKIVPQKSAPKKVVQKKIVPQKSAPKKVVQKKIVPKRPIRLPYDPYWPDSLPKTHFLQLPETLSPKIKELAASITKDRLLPYEKAVALRDYLRTNYKYKLYASPTPEGRESVEYFLFELKEGHCEYFAAALTVLARSQNLPARVATGFSPGNYNALTKLFEVYEYHAHAWAQIYISPVGWLTFDAVPPGDIRSQTTPLGLGRLRDPFGDDWKVMPPELTANAFKMAQNILQSELKQKEEERIRRAQALKEQAKQKNIKKANPRAVKSKNIQKPQKAKIIVRETFSDRLKALFKKQQHKALGHIAQLFDSARKQYTAAALGIALIVLIFLIRPVVFKMKALIYRLRFNHLCRRARETCSTSPEHSILWAYKALRLLLLLSKMPRKNNQELLAYADQTQELFLTIAQKRNIKTASPEDLLPQSRLLALNTRRIFSAFYALEYGNISPGEEDAREVLQKLQEIFALLRELYPNGFFFLELLLFSPPFRK